MDVGVWQELFDYNFWTIGGRGRVYICGMLLLKA